MRQHLLPIAGLSLAVILSVASIDCAYADPDRAYSVAVTDQSWAPPGINAFCYISVRERGYDGYYRVAGWVGNKGNSIKPQESQVTANVKLAGSSHYYANTAYCRISFYDPFAKKVRLACATTSLKYDSNQTITFKDFENIINWNKGAINDPGCKAYNSFKSTYKPFIPPL